jgi:ATP-dependent phosphofructokinase / diphosphate-dependent phosphofructokinase
MAVKRIAINTGGGDAPGLNGVIRAVALSAYREGWELLGIREGYRGLLEDDPELLVKLDLDAVRGILHLGGTILGTTNRGDPFHYPVEEGGKLVPKDMSGRLVERFKELGLDALVALGGDGSMSLATRLMARGLPRVIGVPKTIDNDLKGTDVTFGFETAVSIATEAIDRLHTTAQSHRRVMVVEVMGRDAGWIALHAGIGGGADVILLPEIPFDLNAVCEKLHSRYRRGRRFAIVVVAEGAKLKDVGAVYKGEKGEFREHAQLGGIAEYLARELGTRTGYETRCVVLGHLQRGGSPVTFDRILAQRLGCAAIRYLKETDQSGLVAMRGGHTQLVPFSEVAGGTRGVDASDELVRTARSLGLCLGDEPRGAFES